MNRTGGPAFGALGLVPVEHALLPDVGEARQYDPDVHQHFDEAQPFELAENHRPRQQEHRLDIEQDENDGDQIKLHRETAVGVALRRYAAFIGGALDLAAPPPADQLG